MKRIVRILRTAAIAFLVSVLVPCLSVVVAAEDAGELAQRELADLAHGVSMDNGSALAGEMASAHSAEEIRKSLGARQILSEVLGVTLDALPAAVRALCFIVGLVMICAVIRRVWDSGAGGSYGAQLCSAAVFMAAVFSVQSDSVASVERFFERICSLLEGMIPITGAVWAMGGNVGTASVGTAALYGLVSGVGGFCASTVTPVCCIVCVAAIGSAFSGGELLSGFSRAVKRVYNFVIGVIMSVLVFVLGSQTALAAAADSAAARGAKLVSSTVIPVVGGAVGDTLRAVAGSAQYVKSVVGIGGIVLILVLTLPTLCSLLLFRLALLVGGGAADMMCCPREAKLLGELGNVYGLLVGAVSICSVTFCVSLGIFVKCAVAGA